MQRRSGAFLRTQRALPIAHAGGRGRIHTALCGLPCVIGFPIYAQRRLLDQIQIRDMALAKIPEQSLSGIGTDQACGFGLRSCQRRAGLTKDLNID